VAVIAATYCVPQSEHASFFETTLRDLISMNTSEMAG